jgi:hypothetical protein
MPVNRTRTMDVVSAFGIAFAFAAGSQTGQSVAAKTAPAVTEGGAAQKGPDLTEGGAGKASSLGMSSLGMMQRDAASKRSGAMRGGRRRGKGCDRPGRLGADVARPAWARWGRA